MITSTTMKRLRVLVEPETARSNRRNLTNAQFSIPIRWTSESRIEHWSDFPGLCTIGQIYVYNPVAHEHKGRVANPGRVDGSDWCLRSDNRRRFRQPAPN